MPSLDPPDRTTPAKGANAFAGERTQRITGARARPGLVLGGRYRVERLLGRGGMGEVWLASDLKLCVEVALKSLRTSQENQLPPEMLRREVLAARKVLSPNVCRIFDLIDVDDQELLSMEYVDGTNIVEYLREQGPPSLAGATEIAGQLLSGLQAIHDAGLIHRDLKPENVMITSAGRVVIMDLGIAKAASDRGPGTVAGTPAYMAPEQLRGEPVDARSDIFAAGIILEELVLQSSGDSQVAREDLLRGIRHRPPQLPESPWHDVLQRALADDPADRYPSARSLARALEEISLRGDEMGERNPYPGLASFTEAEAEYFFGREGEVEALGKKLKRLPMLALVGPSGVGKSSFLRAGLIPSLPKGWGCVICTPGPSPFISLGQALAPHVAEDADVLPALVRFGEPDMAVSIFARWRRRRDEVLLVVDQFEELFTQNPRETQERFAAILGRLSLEADVRVLIAIRDDFLFQCHAHPAMQPIFTELSLLTPLAGAGLRRALVQPALACGFRFETDDLVDRMVAEVEDDRGALPLLAFTAARLWQRRDRERGLLAAEAYEAIGGVAGSLAQHAEAIMARIGNERQGLVREIFRNLVTAQRTRVSREREELLSVSEDRDSAEAVLDELINARLLTAYESTDLRDPTIRTQRVEVIHESLLSHWPRLVRWQTQDADGAQLRDQLRKAAQLWEEHSRSEDMLWTGTVYREFRLWRERYPGGLTQTEEAFASAMTSRAVQAQRRRRLALSIAFATLVIVLAVVGTMWERAVAEGRRAESGKLYTLAQNAKVPGYAVAYDLAALELSDQSEYRRLAVSRLLQAPLPIRLPVPPASHNAWAGAFSPDGNWCVIGWSLGGGLQLYSTAGDSARTLVGHRNWINSAAFTYDSKRLVTAASDSTVRLWSVPDGTLLHTWSFPANAISFLPARGDRVITLELAHGEEPLAKSWPIDGGACLVLGKVGPRVTNFLEYPIPDVDPSGTWLALPEGLELRLYALADLARGPVGVIGRQEEPISWVRFSPDGSRIMTGDGKGKACLWSAKGAGENPIRVFITEDGNWPCSFDPHGSRIALPNGNVVEVWGLDVPAARPLSLRTDAGFFSAAIDPRGRWIVTSADLRQVDAWPIVGSYPIALASEPYREVGFAPDGSWVVGASFNGTIKKWSLTPDGFGETETLVYMKDHRFDSLALDDQGHFVFASVQNSLVGNGTLVTISMTDGVVETRTGVTWVLTDSTGRWVASQPEGTMGVPARVLDRKTGQEVELGMIGRLLGFSSDGRLLERRDQSLVAWNVTNLDQEVLQEGLVGSAILCPDRERILLMSDEGRLSLSRLDGSLDTEVPGLFEHLVSKMPIRPVAMTISPAGDLVLFRVVKDGDVHVVRVSDGTEYLVPVHSDYVISVAVDPLGRWVASSGFDGVKLWEIPTGQPYLIMSHEEFLEKLRSMTNLRAVKDDKEPTGYRIEGSGIPDWNSPPRW